MTSNPRQSPTNHQHTADHVARYETLRAYAVEHHVSASRDGLVVLLRQGVAAWMEAWSTLATPPAPPMQTQRQRLSPMPDKVGAEVVHILATMTLGHLQEAHA